MSTIHSLTNNSSLQPQMTQGQLGTGGLDFFSFLLGHQASQTPSQWWGEGFGGEFSLTDLKTQFGQDTELPLLADASSGSLGANGIVGGFTPFVGSPKNVTQPEAQLPVQDVQVAGVQSALVGQESLQALIESSAEAFEPAVWKQAVQSVWGDVQSVSVEEVEAQVPTDTSQHRLIQEVASNQAEAALSYSRGMAEHLAEQSGFDAADNGVVPGGPVKEQVKVASGVSEQLQNPGADEVSGSTGFRNPFAVENLETTIQKAPAMAASNAPRVLPQVFPQVENLARQGGGRMTIEMDPPEMGKLTIEVTTRGKHVELSIRSDNESARAVLQGGLGDLKAALQSQNLQLTSADVQPMGESSFSSLQFGGQGQSHGEHRSQEQGGFRERDIPYFAEHSPQTSRSNTAGTSPAARGREVGRLDVRV